MKTKIQMRMLGLVLILLGLIITSSQLAPQKLQNLNKTKGSKFALANQTEQSKYFYSIGKL